VNSLEDEYEAKAGEEVEDRGRIKTAKEIQGRSFTVVRKGLERYSSNRSHLQLRLTLIRSYPSKLKRWTLPLHVLWKWIRLLQQRLKRVSMHHFMTFDISSDKHLHSHILQPTSTLSIRWLIKSKGSKWWGPLWRWTSLHGLCRRRHRICWKLWASRVESSAPTTVVSLKKDRLSLVSPVALFFSYYSSCPSDVNG
jgi:hypothetical protein